MDLRLTPEDGKHLADTLETVVSDLRMEISHTDRLDYRDALRRRKEALLRVLAQLGRTPAGTI